MGNIGEVLEKLRTLQDVLSERYRIEEELLEIPKALATKSELLARLKKSFVDNGRSLEDSRERVSSLRVQMVDAETERERSEQKIVQINTQREYEALVKEIRDASEKEQSFRKDLQREEKQFEEMNHALGREEALISAQESELVDEQATIAEETEKRRRMVTELQDQEMELTPDLDEELLYKFKRIIRSKAGKGIVPLKHGVCGGCNMILPMQFVNEVRSGERVLFCPYCSLVLFHQGDDDPGIALEGSDFTGLIDDEEVDDEVALDDDVDDDDSDDSGDDDDDEEIVDDEIDEEDIDIGGEDDDE